MRSCRTCSWKSSGALGLLNFKHWVCGFPSIYFIHPLLKLSSCVITCHFRKKIVLQAAKTRHLSSSAANAIGSLSVHYHWPLIQDLYISHSGAQFTGSFCSGNAKQYNVSTDWYWLPFSPAKLSLYCWKWNQHNNEDTLYALYKWDILATHMWQGFKSVTVSVN